jgi:AAA domain
MSFLKKLKPNKPTASLEGYFISMLAKSKFGKTTFAIDLAKEFYGSLDNTLLLATEIGYKTMADVFAIPVTDFNTVDDEDEEYIKAEREDKGFIQTVDELIENKADIPFRFIIIDTITALERYAVAYCIAKANREDRPQKRYTDISDIPWGKGYTMVAEEIYKQIDRLKKAGFGVFIIGHEKTKKITNKDGFEYDFTTFNVLGKTSDIIEREADMIIYGDLQTVKGENGEATEQRKLRFRSDGNILCGTRFRNFPSMIDNNVTKFIETFKEAVLGLYGGNEKAVEQAKAEQEAKAEKQAESLVVEEANSPENLKEKIGVVIEGMEKEDKIKCAKFFKEILGNADYKKSDDVEGLTKALEFVKSL